MSERKFGVGDAVLARWPGSPLYFEGEIEDFNDIEYLVRFHDSDDSKLAVKYRDVKDRDAFRSKSKSRGRSPGRSARVKNVSKSPSRTKGASRSPARDKTQSPSRGRRSNSARAAKTEAKKLLELSRDSKMNSSVTRVQTSSLTFTPLLNSRSSSDDVKGTVLRHSARLAAQNNDIKERGAKQEAPKSKCIFALCLRGAGSSVCALTSKVLSVLVPNTLALVGMVAFSLMPLVFMQTCTKKKCTVKEVPDIPLRWDSYYDLRAIYITVAAFSVFVLLSCMPLRSSKVLPNGAKARGNGLLSLLLFLAAVPAAMYLQYNVQLLYTLMRPLYASHLVLGWLLTIGLYAKSYYAPRKNLNPALTGRFLPDFFVGREVNPRIGSLDIKSLVIRYACCCLAVFNVVLGLRDYQLSKGSVSPVLMTTICMQLIFLLTTWWFEDVLYTTYDYRKRGTGYFLTIAYLLCPWILISYTRIVFNFRRELPWYCLLGLIALFSVGFLISRIANNQKHVFRSNPSSPSVAHMESLPTSAGPRLLVSGLWGVLRHPNLLGDLIMQLTYALLCGFDFGLPWVFLGMTLMFTVMQIYERERECNEKYGLSWSNYTSRVRHRLIPKVF